MDIQGYFTNKGLLLAAKLAAGSTLKITRVCAGAAETAMNASALSQIRQTLSVGAARRSGDTAVLPVTLEAGRTGSAYTLRELGVYAQDPEEGEILYKVYRLSDPVEVRPSSRLVLRFYLEETVSQDLNVTVVRASAGLLTEADLEPLREKIETAGASKRTVELEAAELPAFFNALPRLLTESLTINVSGTLNEHLYLHRFYGGGGIWLEGSGGCTFQKGITVNGCSVSITLKNLEFSGRPETRDEIVLIQNSRYVSMQGCHVAGAPSDSAAGDTGVRVNLSAAANLWNCGVRNCHISVMAGANSTVTLMNDQEGGFSGSSVGAYVSGGGIVLLSGKTPELLGGGANSKSGGLIVKKDGTLL